MAIVIRNNGGKWQKATKVDFAAEAQLQKLLYESPELIPTYEEDKPAVFIRVTNLVQLPCPSQLLKRKSLKTW